MNIGKMPEAGDKWEIRRGYINPDRARLIVEQSRLLTRQVVSCVADVKHTHLFRGIAGLRSTTLHLEGSTRNSGLPTIEHYPWLRRSIPDILDLYEKTSRDTNDTDRTISFLHYIGFGRLGWQRDQASAPEADNTISVTVKGSGKASVRDNFYGKVGFVLEVGDALSIENTGPPEERPMHMARNCTANPRIVFVD